MDFRRIDPTAARIVLIEAGPRIMPTLPENLSDYTRMEGLMPAPLCRGRGGVTGGALARRQAGSRWAGESRRRPVGARSSRDL
jgi:hypothetical protein